MTERRQQHAHDSKFDGNGEEEKTQRDESVTSDDQEHSNNQVGNAANENQDEDDSANVRLSTSSIIELDPEDLLIVKDGTVRVAMSVEREKQQLDANAEAAKASGTWTQAEHDRFLRAMQTYPKGPWKAIAEMVVTRTVRQTQTHAQKYREKMARRMRGLRNRNGTLQTPPQVMPGLPAMTCPRSAAMATSPFAAALAVEHQHQRQHPPQAPYQQLPPHSPYEQPRTQIHVQLQSQSQPETHPHPIAMGYSFAVMAPSTTSVLISQVMAPAASSPAMSRATAVSPGGVPASSTHQHERQYHYTHHLPQPHPPRYASTPVTALSSTGFSQLSQSSISTAFLENAAYPSSWEADRSVGKEAVPGFDESMDFLMNVYSANPNQINALPPQVQPPLSSQPPVPSSTMMTPTASAPRTPHMASPSSTRTRKRREAQSEFSKKRAKTSHESSEQHTRESVDKSDDESRKRQKHGG